MRQWTVVSAGHRYLVKQHTITRYCASMSKMEGEICFDLVPTLERSNHKGNYGRIGVVGGSQEFTGAPFFSAMSALRAGADLAYVFTTPSAAVPIKCYSPELMVLPYLEEPERVAPWLKKLHSVVIGPGLGRTPAAFKNVLKILEKVKAAYSVEGCCSSLIFDADGLMCLEPKFLEDYGGRVYLTPNVVELPHISKGLTHKELSLMLGPKFTLIVKGVEDDIWNDGRLIKCLVEGSGRRCGGQGDILSGVLATFAWWGTMQQSNITDSNMKAAYNACALTRTSNRIAFETHFRGTLASDMIQELPKAFQLLFE